MLSIFFFSLRKWKDKMFSHDDYVFHWREKIIRKWGVPIWPVSFRFSFWFFFHKRCNLYGLLYSETHVHTNINVCITYNLLATHLSASLATSIFLPVPDFNFGLSLYIEYDTLWIIFFNKIRKPIVKQLTLITFFILGRRTYGRSMWA